MRTRSSSPAPSFPSGTTDQETCLLPATRLGDFIDFVRERGVGGSAMDRGDLAQVWREAVACFEAIQIAEAGAADKLQVLPLPRRMQLHVDKLVQLPTFNQTFSTVPVAFGLVELDKLVVYQQFVTGSTLDHLGAALPAAMTPTDLVKLCLPLNPPQTGFKLARRDGDQFVFLSDNHDGRFLGAQTVEPSRVGGLEVNGHAQAVVALAFGFTTNVLNVVRFGSRMVLNNGYHRALALRARGVTHAPCIIQVCGHWDEVGLAGARAIYDHGELFFSQPRPPLLCDFFNGQLICTWPTYRLRKEIRLTVKVETLKLAV